jgi:hypothetical protein
MYSSTRTQQINAFVNKVQKPTVTQRLAQAHRATTWYLQPCRLQLDMGDTIEVISYNPESKNDFALCLWTKDASHAHSIPSKEPLNLQMSIIQKSVMPFRCYVLAIEYPILSCFRNSEWSSIRRSVDVKIYSCRNNRIVVLRPWPKPKQRQSSILSETKYRWHWINSTIAVITLRSASHRNVQVVLLIVKNCYVIQFRHRLVLILRAPSISW